MSAEKVAKDGHCLLCTQQVRACSMGDRSFFVVSLTRSEAEESLTLVTDNKGHVVHATQVSVGMTICLNQPGS
jgi:hypothetical protein